MQKNKLIYFILAHYRHLFICYFPLSFAFWQSLNGFIALILRVRAHI